MKFFQISQKNFSLLGIIEEQSNSTRNKLMMIYLIYGLGIISTVLFLVFEANTFIQYVDNAFITVSTIVACICFTFIAVRRDQLVELIDFAEEIVDKSECVFWIFWFEILLK